MTKLDEMLSQWPMRDATQLEADEAAERVTSAITAGQLPASIDESLLAAPLPKTPDEGQTSAPRTSKPGLAAPGIAVENKMSKDRTRDRTSFQELAKLATTPPPPTSVVPSSPSSSGQSGVLRAKEAESSDSGIVDLKMIAQLDPTGAQRAQSTPLASDGLFDDESAPPKPAVTAAVAEKAMASAAPSAPAAASAVAQPVAAAPSAKAAMAKEEKKGGGGIVLVFGGLVAAAAIAAGGFFFIKYQRAHHAVATQSAPAADTAKAANDKPAATTAATTTAAASVAQNDTQAAPDVIADPNMQGKTMPKIRVKPGAGGGGGGTAQQDTTPAPTGTVDPKLVANVPTGGAGGGSGDLAEAMKAAAGGGTGLGQGGAQTSGGSTFAPGSVPQRPSQGQVAGAIGSVMPSAKACLGGDDPMSRATVTFQSDGTVKSVSVTGFAAGKPQEACIKAALSKAKVDPFAEATYPVPVSIRSN